MSPREPRLSYASRLHPQMATALAKQKELAPRVGEMSRLSLDEGRRAYIEDRRYWNADAPPVHAIRNGVVAGSSGDSRMVDKAMQALEAGARCLRNDRLIPG